MSYATWEEGEQIEEGMNLYLLYDADESSGIYGVEVRAHNEEEAKKEAISYGMISPVSELL